MTESRHPTQRRSVLLVPQVKALTLQPKLCLEKLVHLLSAVLRDFLIEHIRHLASVPRLAETIQAFAIPAMGGVWIGLVLDGRALLRQWRQQFFTIFCRGFIVFAAGEHQMGFVQVFLHHIAGIVSEAVACVATVGVERHIGIEARPQLEFVANAGAVGKKAIKAPCENPTMANWLGLT